MGECCWKKPLTRVMMFVGRIRTCGVLICLISSISVLLVGAITDDWDDLDEPVLSVPFQLPSGSPLDANEAVKDEKPQRLVDRSLPYFMIIFLVGSMVVSVVGGRANAKRMLAFEECFCSEPDGLLRKHFTRLGKGGGKLLVNESSSTCKLHANGHQHLDGAVITLTMLRRHELVSLIAQTIGQQEDVLCMEMYVKENCMPPMVMAIATPLTHKELLRNHKDVKLLAPRLEVKEEKIRDWPKNDLIVYAEHASYFYDMMTKAMLAQVFGGVAFPKHKRYFRGLQMSSESSSSHRKVVRFWFGLPSAEHMGELLTLMQAALAMVNQAASYSISPERQKQAEQAHAEFGKQIGRKERSAFTKDVMEVGRSKQKRK